MEQVRIRCPAVEDMSVKELRDHVEELKVRFSFSVISFCSILVSLNKDVLSTASSILTHFEFIIALSVIYDDIENELQDCWLDEVRKSV